MPTNAISVGRRPSTTKVAISDVAVELFTRQGFDETSVDEIADAVGVSRRTLFRYYPSKNAIAWGDFDVHLRSMRAHLSTLPADMPIAEALHDALLAFNEIPAHQVDAHRRRMTLLLTVPTLQAHSMLMYTEWRAVIAEFVAARSGTKSGDHYPQTVGWVMLGVALAAYEQWLATPNSDLATLLSRGASTLGSLPEHKLP